MKCSGRRWHGAWALVLALAGAPAAPAQEWPQRPVRLVVTFPAGTGADLVARLVAPGLAERLGQPVVVDNRPGADSRIGMKMVARSEPDGYTLLLAATSFVANPHLYKLDYDPVKELVPVAQLARTHFALLASPSFPASTVRETLEMAKARPGALTCAHSGGALQIACAWLAAAGGVDLTLVPYRGGMQALYDVLGGRADLVFGILNTVVPLAQDGRVKVLALTGARRGSGPFGDSPTLSETLPGFELTSWLGLVAPTETPAAIRARVHREAMEVLGQPDVRKRIEEGGLEVAGASPEAFGEIIRRDHAKFGRIIQQTGIRVE